MLYLSVIFINHIYFTIKTPFCQYRIRFLTGSIVGSKFLKVNATVQFRVAFSLRKNRKKKIATRHSSGVQSCPTKKYTKKGFRICESLNICI